jgi:GNAT superfamily N-acetyltransferase
LTRTGADFTGVSMTDFILKSACLQAEHVRFALAAQFSDSARTYVSHCEDKVLGYYSLAAGSVRREDSPTRIAQGLANHPIPAILFARLAVDRLQQGKGSGKILLMDALCRAATVAEIIGALAILVHALDDEAAAFYRKFGFEPSPLDSKQLLLLMKELRAQLHSLGLSA